MGFKISREKKEKEKGIKALNETEFELCQIPKHLKIPKVTEWFPSLNHKAL